MKKILTILTLLITLTTVQAQHLILGTNNNAIWGKDNTKDITLVLDFKSKVKPSSMTIGYDTPNGTKFRIYFKDINVAIDLRYVISMERGINNWGDCDDGYYVQCATHDFDNDKNPEIIIAVGNGSFDMWVNVIKFHPPASSDDAIRTENWSVIASFSGQEKIHIDGHVITVPFGSQGLFNEYTWVNGKFVKTN
jgi:hypothetical protein